MLSELRTKLEALGFTTRDARTKTEAYVTTGWTAWRTLKTSVLCQCNERPPALHISVYAVYHDGKQHSTAEVDVTGELADIWHKMSAYGIPTDTLIDRLDEIERKLATAWEMVGANHA